MKLSETLELTSEKHETLGDIFVLYCKVHDDGGAAYFIDEREYFEESGVVDENTKTKEVVPAGVEDIGVGIRLTKETATKLAWQLLNAVGSA